MRRIATAKVAARSRESSTSCAGSSRSFNVPALPREGTVRPPELSPAPGTRSWLRWRHIMKADSHSGDMEIGPARPLPCKRAASWRDRHAGHTICTLLRIGRWRSPRDCPSDIRARQRERATASVRHDKQRRVEGRNPGVSSECRPCHTGGRIGLHTLETGEAGPTGTDRALPSAVAAGATVSFPPRPEGRRLHRRDLMLSPPPPRFFFAPGSRHDGVPSRNADGAAAGHARRARRGWFDKASDRAPERHDCARRRCSRNRTTA